MCEKTYDKYSQYSRTKLMNHMITFALHRLLYHRGLGFQVTANVIDAEEPAENHSELVFFFWQLFTFFFAFFSVTCLSASRGFLCGRANGVHTVVRLVESPDLAHVSGKYFDCIGREIRSLTDAIEERAQQKLWLKDEQFCEELGTPSPKNEASRPSSASAVHLGTLEAAKKHLLQNNNSIRKLQL